MKKKIIFFIVTTLILGTLTFLIIRNTEKKEIEKEYNPDGTEVVEAKVESIDYDKYMELRSKAHDTESYAILIWNSTEEISIKFLEEVKKAFQNRTSVVYTIDLKEVSKENNSRIIDDVSGIMKYKNPTLIVPTILVMTKGDIVYSRAGFMYMEELRDHLNSKSVE